MKEHNYPLGLDFGTSNSSIGAVVDNHLIMAFLQRGALTQPSCIYLDAFDIYHSVGFKAIRDFQKPDKEKGDNYHFVPNIKPALHQKEYTGITLQSKRQLRNGHPTLNHISTERMVALVLEDLKLFADAQLNIESDTVLIGRPVYFSTDEEEDRLAQKRLEKSAQAVGFRQISFMPEPVAAGLHYERSSLTEAEKVLIFDFGGGTLDVACLKLIPQQSITETSLTDKILSTYGIELGGTDLDKDIFQALLPKLLGERCTWGKKNYIFLITFIMI